MALDPPDIVAAVRFSRVAERAPAGFPPLPVSQNSTACSLERRGMRDRAPRSSVSTTMMWHSLARPDSVDVLGRMVGVLPVNQLRDTEV